MTSRFQHILASSPVLLLLLAVACVWGCAARSEFEPYRVPREEFRRLVHTIGILPPGIALSKARRREVAGYVEAALTETFRRLGYEVVGSDVVGPVWRRYASQISGLFNPLTGNPDEKKLETTRSYVARELARTHKVDVLAVTWTNVYRLLPPAIEQRGPRFKGEMLDFYGQPLLDMPQLVEAVSLHLELLEPDGRSLYAASVPVQWTKVYVARSYYTRPEGELLSLSRVDAAIRVLLAKLEPAGPRASGAVNNP